MLSRSEGWGGLFKDEQYRLTRCASRISVRSALRAGFEQTAPSAPSAQPPRLTQAGNGQSYRLGRGSPASPKSISDNWFSQRREKFRRLSLVSGIRPQHTQRLRQGFQLSQGVGDRCGIRPSDKVQIEQILKRRSPQRAAFNFRQVDPALRKRPQRVIERAGEVADAEY